MGLSVAFDLATHRGYDSDHPRWSATSARPAVGDRLGEDMKILFGRVALDRMSCR